MDYIYHFLITFTALLGQSSVNNLIRVMI